MKKLEDTEEGVWFALRLTPRSSRNEIVGWTGNGELKVRVTAPPVEGEANRKLIAFLARCFDVPRAQVRLLSGERSKRKLILVPSSCKNRLLSLPDI